MSKCAGDVSESGRKRFDKREKAVV